MEIINHSHASIRQKTRNQMIITFAKQKDGKDKVYFSKAISDFLGNMKGKYIHFIGSLRDLYFICNYEEDGFCVLADTRVAYTFHISSSAFLRWFYHQTGYKEYPCSFYVTKTESYLNNCRIIKIELNQTVDQLIQESYKLKNKQSWQDQNIPPQNR